MTRPGPLIKTVRVDLRPADAFQLFTGRIAEWWPLEEYSISGSRAAGCVIEPREGGAVFEVRDDGETFPWGQVLVWDPPHRLVMMWHPERAASTAQEVEVRFEVSGRGTLVELEHRGWAVLGDDAPALRRRYESGWDTVLGVHFARAGGGVPSTGR